MDQNKRKIAQQGIDDAFIGSYDPLDDMSPEVQARITQIPYAQQNGAIEAEIANLDPYSRIKHFIKSQALGNKRDRN